MAYEPLHHKYRPQTFAQLAGQEAIAQTLTNAITKNKIVPAYLFCGPRGTGKTSSARILAKSLNCLESEQPTVTPCGTCEVCRSIINGSALDVIEIDAASNTGVDNIREIIEKAQFAPVKCRYKVYVIDECHMLSTAAFNALLKTLEEPSPRVIFVLATTDPQRVLPTIISRCQRFDYRRIPLEAMVKHLEDIAQKEEIDINSEAIALVAQLANGGMRDAQTLLDQLSLLSGTITPERVWDLVGAVSEQDLLGLIQAIASDNPEGVISQCRKLLDRGREPLIVLQNLASFYLNLLIAKTAPEKQDLVAITNDTWQQLCQEAQQWELSTILQGQKKLKDSEVQIKNTTQPRLWLEITLLSLLPSANVVVTKVANPATPPIKTQPQATNNIPVTVHKQPTPQTNHLPSQVTHTPTNHSPEAKPEPEPELTVTPASEDIPTAHVDIDLTTPDEIKEKVAAGIIPTMTKSFLRQQCYLTKIEGATVTIGVISKGLLNIAKTQQKDIEAGFTKVFGKPMSVFFFADKDLKTKNPQIQISKPQPETQTPPPSNTTVKPEEKIEETKEAIAPSASVTPSPVENSSPVAQPLTTPPVETITKGPVIESSSSTEEVQKAAENLAKSFKGEIVLTETKEIQWEQITDTNHITIVNRPSVEDFEDEDDIPF